MCRTYKHKHMYDSSYATCIQHIHIHRAHHTHHTYKRNTVMHKTHTANKQIDQYIANNMYATAVRQPFCRAAVPPYAA